MGFDFAFFTPLILFIIFLALGVIFLIIGSRISEKGEDVPAKYIHYSCGEEMELPSLILNYRSFFRLALLFCVIHIVVLVISTIPSSAEPQLIPIVYIFAAGVSMLILLEQEKHE